jgi:hypothetical protein
MPKVIKEAVEPRSNNIKNIYIQKINSLMKISKDTIEKSEIDALNHTNRYLCFIIKGKKSKNTSLKVNPFHNLSLKEYHSTLKKPTVSQKGPRAKENLRQVIGATRKKTQGCVAEDRKCREYLIRIRVAIGIKAKRSNQHGKGSDPAQKKQ